MLEGPDLALRFTIPAHQGPVLGFLVTSGFLYSLGIASSHPF